MSDEFKGLSQQEKLKAENEFLKMKLMLENGAQFGFANTENEIPPEIENAFLRNIEAFERKSANLKYITVFEKIKRPDFFRPVAEIPDAEIYKAWKDLRRYLARFSISVDVCSPNISNRELYRFTTEELFKHEMEDMNIPGMQTGFIYDEFHPDPVYDNSRMVEQDLFGDIFRKTDLFYEIHYRDKGFVFNNRVYENSKLFVDRINRFKSLFDEIDLTSYSTTACRVMDNNCKVEGSYEATAKTENNISIFKGVFEVDLVLSEIGYWDFKQIRIDGFDPQ
ncbi:MAG TPA: hypothetical protein VGO58_10380 [Chitinophagaceae bacterium]|nr:hypothetical protein [Chitinophagaceae bacterium]